MKISDKLWNAAGYALELAGIYNDKRVSRSAAALSYFLTMSLFPTLICIQAMVASMAADIGPVLDGLQNVVPAATLSFIREYLGYVSSKTAPP